MSPCAIAKQKWSIKHGMNSRHTLGDQNQQQYAWVVEALNDVESSSSLNCGMSPLAPEGPVTIF